MATINDRPFSRNYSGLINQSVLAVGIFVICITSHEFMKRKRRGQPRGEGLGSVETWQFGYLYQGRSWARKASPPIAQGWPLSWARQALRIPDKQYNELRGVDATLYVRFLRGCVWFTLAQMLTTFPILLPIHITFADGSVLSKSMTRASISSLINTAKGPSLLWIHLLLLIWVTFSWTATLSWICRGTFRYRGEQIRAAAKRAVTRTDAEKETQNYPHPHPQYPFYSLPQRDHNNSSKGIRTRTVMVTNIPPSLRSEKDLKEYFEYYLSRPLVKSTMGVTSAAQPGFIDRSLAFVFNKTRLLASRLHKWYGDSGITHSAAPEESHGDNKPNTCEAPLIERVVLVRKMSDLASLLEKREEVLKNLETAHIKLARNALKAVSEALGPKSKTERLRSAANSLTFGQLASTFPTGSLDLERDAGTDDGADEGEDRLHLLVRTLAPYVEDLRSTGHDSHAHSRWPRWLHADKTSFPCTSSTQKARAKPEKTVWEALLSLPRSTLDAYQPLIHLSALFRGKTVPSIDYYTAKLNLLTALITEKRAQSTASYPAMPTAFLTFADPADARRACKYLAVHPNNPVNVCLVTMAPSYEDLDWTRLMKSTFRVEFVKDWVVNMGVWGFTIFWVFPVTSIVGLVSIQNISNFWPGLKNYLDRHEFQSEVLQSLVPTLLVSGLALLVPLILLLIAKKAHTISTLSALHDRIMTRYYKFLIVNVLVFFCVGTAALQSFLVSFKASSGQQLLQTVAVSFPTAAPFYVGWLIFTMALHGGLELALFGLPLMLYPSTKQQLTPRKRAVGIRPRTFNYYYWLPNHLLVIHILLVFAVLNPLVIPFGFLYFCVEVVVIKNQLLHVYARNYEGNGQAILIRLIRYSSDGLILAQAVFLAYMVVVKVKTNVAVSGVLIILTVFAKVSLTRFCRWKFERDDLLEAQILSGSEDIDPTSYVTDLLDSPSTGQEEDILDIETIHPPRSRLEMWTWKFTSRVAFSYGTGHKRHHATRRQPNPFGPRSSGDSGVPLHACSSTAGLLAKEPLETAPSISVLANDAIPEEQPEDPTLDSPQAHTPLVVSHPHHPRWDDESDPNTTYDNPFYTQPISDMLWLPRDPFSIIDLDDTIDLRISISSEPGAGKLGAWAEDEFIGTALSSVFAGSFGSLDDESSSMQQSRHLDGNEVISLSSGIKSRVDSIDHERDIETSSPRRPSLVPRTLSNASAMSQRRPATLDVGPSGTGFRSFSLSLGASSTTDILPSPVTHLSVPSGHRRQRSASVDVVGMHARSVPTSASIRSILRTPSGPVTPGATSIISTREAVVGEAIAEWQEAEHERRRQEEAEEEKAKEPRSWLTAWMFARPTTPHAHTS